MSEYFVYMYVCVPHVFLVLTEVIRRHFGTGVTGGYERPCRYQESKPGPLQEKHILYLPSQSLVFVLTDVPYGSRECLVPKKRMQTPFPPEGNRDTFSSLVVAFA